MTANIFEAGQEHTGDYVGGLYYYLSITKATFSVIIEISYRIGQGRVFLFVSVLTLLMP